MAYTNSNQIGEITEVTGVAKITRTDGTEETVTLGTKIFQGDIVETDTGAVNIGFVDDSEFAVSNGARITIDEFVFDPETEGGVQDFTVDSGVFMYTSGLIGRENPDQVEIDTPVGSIGIRGTIIGGNINPEGESQVSVLEGAIVVRNDAGEQLLTNQFETVKLTSRDVAPSNVKQMNAAEIANDYGAIKDVSVNLFSSLNDQMAQEGLEQPAAEQPVETPAEEAAVEAEAEAEQTTEEVLAEDQVEAAAEGEEALEETQPEQETLEETIEQIETLDDMPEMKTMDMREGGDKPRMSKMMESRKDAMAEAAEANDVQINVEPVIVPISLKLVSSNPLQEANNGRVFENSTGANIQVGQVALDNATSVEYSLANDFGGRFSINSDGQIFFNAGSSHNRDFESGDGFDLRVRARDLETGRFKASTFRVELNDVSETPELRVSQDSVFDNGTSTPSALVDINQNGARIAKLDIADPNGATYNLGDLSINATLSGFPITEAGKTEADYFTFVEDNGAFYLQLESNTKIVQIGSDFILNSGGNPVSGLFATENIVIDVAGIPNPLTVDIAPVQFREIASDTDVSADDYVIDTSPNGNLLTINDGDFQFIDGGKGYDRLELSKGGVSGPQTYDFTGTSSAFQTDIVNIEQIAFWQSGDELKLDMQSLIKLIETSDFVNSDYGHKELVIANNGGSGNKVTFVDSGGSTVRLNHEEANGVDGFEFIRTDERSGVDYAVYQHDDIGVVAIATNIEGAMTGGF